MDRDNTPNKWVIEDHMAGEEAPKGPRGCLGALVIAVVSVAAFAVVVWLGLTMTKPAASDRSPVAPKSPPQLQTAMSEPREREPGNVVEPPPEETPENQPEPPRPADAPPVAAIAPPSELPGPPLTAEQVRSRSHSVVQVVAWDKQFRPMGSALGAIVSKDGWVLTNSTVVDTAYAGLVRLHDGRGLFIEGVAARDTDAHAALIKVQGRGLPALRISGAGPPSSGVGVWAFSDRGIRVAPVQGAVRRQIKLSARYQGMLIRTERPMSAGSHGGPVLAMDGTAVGMVIPAGSIPSGARVAPAAALVSLVRQPGDLHRWASAGSRPLDAKQAATFDRAWQAWVQGENAIAFERLGTLQDSQEGSAWFWHAMGRLQTELRRRKDAAAAYRTAVALRPDDAHLSATLADTLVSLGQHEEAVKMYRAAIAADGGTVKTHTRLGNSLRLLGRFQHAVEAYNTAISIKTGAKKVYDTASADARHAEAYLGMGTTYEQLGTTSHARRFWMRAAKLGKGTSVGEEAARRLREMAGGATQETPPETDPKKPANGEQPR